MSLQLVILSIEQLFNLPYMVSPVEETDRLVNSTKYSPIIISKLISYNKVLFCNAFFNKDQAKPKNVDG